MRVILAGIVVAIGIIAAPASAPADYCEIIECWRECQRVPGGRWCVRRCSHHCWREPRYDPPPPPRYHVEPPPPPSQHPVPAAVAPYNPVPDILFFAVVSVLAAVIVLAFSATDVSTSSIDKEIAAIEQSAHSARSLAQEAENKTHEIDAAIAQIEAEHFERGRRAAQDDWNANEWTNHG